MLVLLISTMKDPSGRRKRDVIAELDLVDIASRAGRSEPEAYAELFDLFFEKLRRYAYYKTGDIDLAEDIAAEALTKGLESMGGFEDRGGTIGAWLFGIARNVLARHREASGKAELVDLDEDLPGLEEERPENIVLARMSHQNLYEALSRLPEEQREVVLLRFMERYDTRTVARIMEKRPGAVRALQHRAISSLRGMLTTEGVGDEA